MVIAICKYRRLRTNLLLDIMGQGVGDGGKGKNRKFGKVRHALKSSGFGRHN